MIIKLISICDDQNSFNAKSVQPTGLCNGSTPGSHPFITLSFQPMDLCDGSDSFIALSFQAKGLCGDSHSFITLSFQAKGLCDLSHSFIALWLQPMDLCDGSHSFITFAVKNNKIFFQKKNKAFPFISFIV